MKNLIVVAVCAILGTAGITLQAQQSSARIVGRNTGLHFAEAVRPLDGNGTTTIMGTVIDIRQVPVKAARLRLRNIKTGTVSSEAVSNDQGQYTFEINEPGTYIVEMILADGSIVALSNAGAIARYETIQTLVLLPGRWEAAKEVVVPVSEPTNFVGMSAQATMTHASLALAIDQNVRPFAQSEPVSAH